MSELDTQRKHIADKVRELRRGRRWTQAELAGKLELSQSRLSEIETGHGSFTAEQLLRVLALFNVGVDEFVGRRNDPTQELQNALARMGAKNLLESDRVVPTERRSELRDVIRDALLDGSPRLVTAIGPVLLANPRISVDSVYFELERLGRGRRLPWAVDNTLAALAKLAKGRDASLWAKLQFGTLALQVFVRRAPTLEKLPRKQRVLDILDPSIRTDESRDQVQRTSSAISKKWGIITSLRVEDFVDALRAAR
jgi:transcriptional regulator with XRE-family HTH domain